MFKLITPGSVVIEGRVTTIDRGSEECFVNFYDGTTVRINGTHNPVAFNAIMMTLAAMRDTSALVNAELNFISGKFSMNGSRNSNPHVTAKVSPKPVPSPTSVQVDNTETKTKVKSKVPPVGVKKIAR